MWRTLILATLAGAAADGAAKPAFLQACEDAGDAGCAAKLAAAAAGDDVATVAAVAKNMRKPSWRPTTTRHPLIVYSASKKPRHCFARRCPWRDAFLERVVKSRSR